MSTHSLTHCFSKRERKTPPASPSKRARVKAKDDKKRTSDDIEAEAPNDDGAENGDASSSDSLVSKAGQSKKPKNDKPAGPLINISSEEEVSKVLDQLFLLHAITTDDHCASQKKDKNEKDNNKDNKEKENEDEDELLASGPTLSQSTPASSPSAPPKDCALYAS